MEKAKVIALFGSVTATAKALGISPQAVSDWPDTLSPAVADRVRGACARLRVNLTRLDAAYPKKGRR